MKLLRPGDKVVRTDIKVVGDHPLRARRRKAPDGSRYWTVEVMLDDLEELVDKAAEATIVTAAFMIRRHKTEGE